jgi:hypothetical protein
VWTLSGDPISASGHHHAAINALLCWPLPAAAAAVDAAGRDSSGGAAKAMSRSSTRGRASSAGGAKEGSGRPAGGAAAAVLWAGAQDGTLSVAEAGVDETGATAVGAWRQLSATAAKGERCTYNGGSLCLWSTSCGCDRLVWCICVGLVHSHLQCVLNISSGPATSKQTTLLRFPLQQWI